MFLNNNLKYEEYKQTLNKCLKKKTKKRKEKKNGFSDFKNTFDREFCPYHPPAEIGWMWMCGGRN